MRIVVYADNTLPLAVPVLCERLNGICSTVRFSAGSVPFRLTESKISSPGTYRTLPAPLHEEAAQFDLACLATAVPYGNNFFYEEKGREVLVSFSNWNLLTDLAITNGLVYMIACMLLDVFKVGRSHGERTGCANDFFWDKRDIDVAMRAAFVCGQCLAAMPADAHTKAILRDVRALLDAVSRASRAHLDLLAVEAPRAVDTATFDVFLCHNSADKPAVRELNARLRAGGIRTWLDEDQLLPGRPWQPELERQIAQVSNAAVLVGGSGRGPWQDAEMRAFLNEFATRECPVIPILLPTAPLTPDLPIFLKQMTWIDLRDDDDASLERLIEVLRRRA